MPRGRHPNSLANLKRGSPGRPFVKGFDPRRAMPCNIGESLLHWIAVLDEQDGDGKAKYSDDALQTIVKDGTLSRTKRAAAAHLLRLTSVEHAKNGLPLANADLERLLDRTVGRPKTSIEVTRRVEGPSLPEVIKEAQAIARQLGPTIVQGMVEDLQAQAGRDNCRPRLTTAAAGSPDES